MGGLADYFFIVGLDPEQALARRVVWPSWAPAALSQLEAAETPNEPPPPEPVTAAPQNTFAQRRPSLHALVRAPSALHSKKGEDGESPARTLPSRALRRASSFRTVLAQTTPAPNAGTVGESVLAEFKTVSPAQYRFAPDVLQRLPADNAAAGRGRFPAFLPLFCHPDDVQLQLQQAPAKRGAPAPTHHAFVVTDEDGSRRYGLCVTVWEPLGAAHQSQLESMLVQWRRCSMDRKDVEYLTHIETQLAEQDALIARLDAEHRDERPSQESVYLAQRRQARERQQLYRDLLARLRASLQLHDGPAMAPKTLGILSRWPLYDFFRDWLCEVALGVAQRRTPPGWLEATVTNLLFEVPVPPPGRLEVALTAGEKTLYCRRSPPTALHPVRGYSSYPLFRALSREHVVQLFEMVLLEQQILLVSTCPSMLGLAAAAVTGFLAPLEWQHVLIPVLPGRLAHYVQAPLPYIIGVQRQVYDDLLGGNGRFSELGDRSEAAALPPDVVIVDLDRDLVTTGAGDSVRLAQLALPARERAELLAELERYTAVPDNVAAAGLASPARGTPRGMQLAFAPHPVDESWRTAPVTGFSAVAAANAARVASVGRVPPPAVALLQASLSRASLMQSFGGNPGPLAGPGESAAASSRRLSSLSTAGATSPLGLTPAGSAVHRRSLSAATAASMGSMGSRVLQSPRGSTILVPPGNLSGSMRLSHGSMGNAIGISETAVSEPAAAPTTAPTAAQQKPPQTQTHPQTAIENQLALAWDLFQLAGPPLAQYGPLAQLLATSTRVEGHRLAEIPYALYKFMRYSHQVAPVIGTDPGDAAVAHSLLVHQYVDLVDDGQVLCNACWSACDGRAVALCLDCGLAVHPDCTESLDCRPCSRHFNEGQAELAFTRAVASLLRNYRKYLVAAASSSPPSPTLPGSPALSSSPASPVLSLAAPASPGAFPAPLALFRKDEFCNHEAPKRSKGYVARLLATQAFDQFAMERIEAGAGADPRVHVLDGLIASHVARERSQSLIMRNLSGASTPALPPAPIAVSSSYATSFAAPLVVADDATPLSTAVRADRDDEAFSDCFVAPAPQGPSLTTPAPPLRQGDSWHFPDALAPELCPVPRQSELLTVFDDDTAAAGGAQALRNNQQLFERLRSQQTARQRQQFKQWFRANLVHFGDLGQDEMVALGMLSEDERLSLFSLRLVQVERCIASHRALLGDLEASVAQLKAPVSEAALPGLVSQLRAGLKALYEQNTLLMRMADEEQLVGEGEESEFQTVFGDLIQLITGFEDLAGTVEALVVSGGASVVGGPASVAVSSGSDAQ